MEYITSQRKIYWGGLLVLAIVIGFFFIPPEIFFRLSVALTGIILFAVFLFNLRLGLYALAATAFFHGWDIVLGRYAWAKQVAYLASINAPVVDFFALVLGGAMIVSYVLGIAPFRFERLKFIKPLAILYGLFLASACISVVFAYDHHVLTAARYLLRSMAFVFAAYVVIPHLLIHKREVLMNVLKVWYVVGVAVALFGLSSLVIAPQQGWVRVTPYRIGDFAPLGYNHNLIAEVLTAILPAAIYLWYRQWQAEAKNKQRFNTASMLLGGGVILMGITTLLTLSRAGWLALGVEVVVGAYFFRHQLERLFSRHKQHIAIVAVGALVLIGYMVVFLTSATVKSSTATRWQLTEITSFYTLRSPLVGYGPGMFTVLLGDTIDYIIEHGVILDSHGIIQKILLEEGVLGFIIFVAFFVRYAKTIVAAASPVAQDSALMPAMIATAAGSIVFQLFNTSYFTSVMWLPLGVVLAAAHIIHDRSS